MTTELEYLLPNPFAVDYQVDPPLDLYTEPEMIRYGLRIINEIEVLIAKEQALASGDWKCKDGVNIWWKIREHLTKDDDEQN